MKMLFVIACAMLLVGCTVYRDTGPETGPVNDKVYVCHKGKQTIRVDDEAVRAHLNHGDDLGTCP